MSKQSAKSSAEHRKAVVAAAKEAERRRRIGARIGVVAGILVLAAVAVLIVITVTQPAAEPTPVSADSQIIPAAPRGSDVTRQADPTSVTNPTDIEGVLAWDTVEANPGGLEHTHVDGPVTYTVSPPIGGPHSAIWMNAGVYTEPIPSERAVHNLEHGAVWITYDPSLPADQVAQLTAFVASQSLISEDLSSIGVTGAANRYIDLSPWATSDLPSPIVISSWGYQLQVTDPTDPRLQQFVDTFRNSATYSPEFGEPVEGIPIQTGGRADSNGGTQPNPAGSAN
jgi:hypothetical protein